MFAASEGEELAVVWRDDFAEDCGADCPGALLQLGERLESKVGLGFRLAQCV